MQASALATKNEVAIPEDLSPDPLELNYYGVDLGDCDYLVWPKEKLCPRGDTDGDKTLVLLGDSHGRAWIPALDKIGEKYGSAKTIISSATNLYGAGSTKHRQRRARRGLHQFRDWAIDQIDQLHPQLTIMASDAPFDRQPRRRHANAGRRPDPRRDGHERHREDRRQHHPVRPPTGSWWIGDVPGSAVTRRLPHWGRCRSRRLLVAAHRPSGDDEPRGRTRP